MLTTEWWARERQERQESALTICANNVLFGFLMRGNHSAGEEEQWGERKKEREVEEGMEGRRGEQETVIISSLSCVSQPVLQPLPGKLGMHTKSFYSKSALPDSSTTTEAFLFSYLAV